MQYDRRTLIASLAGLPLCAATLNAADAQQIPAGHLHIGITEVTTNAAWYFDHIFSAG